MSHALFKKKILLISSNGVKDSKEEERFGEDFSPMRIETNDFNCVDSNRFRKM